MEKTLNFSIKISVFLILFYTLDLNLWLFSTLKIFGIPELRFQKFFFFFAPGAYILNHAFRNGRLKTNNLFLFLIVFLVHYLMEKFLYGQFYVNETLDIINLWFVIFFTTLFLINAGSKYQIFILKSSITLFLINILIIYSSIFGGLNIADTNMQLIGFQGRISSSLNMNLVCDSAVFSIYIYYFLNLLNVDFKLSKYRIPIYIYILFTVPLIFFQASRGSFFLLSIFFLFFLYQNFKNLSKISIPFLFLLIFLIGFSTSNLNFSEYNLFSRINDSNTSLRSAVNNSDGRFLQIVAANKNFKSSPFVGVGTQNSAANVYEGITRSNFQYSNILASGGILFFIFYFSFIFKFFAHSFKLLLFDARVRMILLFVLVLFIFRRADNYLSIFAFLTYVFNNEMKNKIA